MEYRVVYSGRRTVGLTVRGGLLTVRAPYGTPTEELERIVAAHREWVARAIERQASSPLQVPLTSAEIDRLRRQARAELTARTRTYAACMGLCPRRITITGARTRFGSCSSQGNIAYSYRLMLYPEACWDYVVVHELSHLVHLDHSPAFYALVGRYLPDYRERQRLLRHATASQ